MTAYKYLAENLRCPLGSLMLEPIQSVGGGSFCAAEEFDRHRRCTSVVPRLWLPGCIQLGGTLCAVLTCRRAC